MKHFLTQHVWLQNNQERTLVSNIRTGRRALLDETELAILDQFTGEGAELDPENPTHQRLLQADLVVSDTPESPRLDALSGVLNRHLFRDQNIRKTDIAERFPTILDKLAAVREFLWANALNNTHTPTLLNRDLGALFAHVATYLSEEEELPTPSLRFRAGFPNDTAGRPLPREDYEQQPCMPETSQRRVEFCRPFLTDDSRVLILGDDDLLSLYWSKYQEQACDVFELDEELIKFLSPRLAAHVHMKSRDLTLGLPEEFHGLYDVIFTDPMYEQSGMDLFMKCCADALSNNENARVLFTTRPDMIDAGDRFEERLHSVGLAVESQHKDFSRYRLPDIYRRKLVQGFNAHGISPQLIQGLTQIPYLYADLFVLKSI